MRAALWLIVAGLPTIAFAQSAPRTMSDIMVKVLYPNADAIFYIETRTPADEAGWTTLRDQTRQLSEAAVELTIPRWARGREQWLADAKLLVDASAAASAAASRRDVKALVDLNDALYTSCVQCHQHYRPNYGRRPTGSQAPAQPPDLEGVWSFATLTPFERPAEFADKAVIAREEAEAWVRQTLERNNRDRRDGGAEAGHGRGQQGLLVRSRDGAAVGERENPAFAHSRPARRRAAAADARSARPDGGPRRRRAGASGGRPGESLACRAMSG